MTDMKKMGIASFTARGKEAAIRLGALFQKEYEILFYYKDGKESLKEWCGRCFSQAEALIFVGACGIAVRTIAPFLQDKTRDPAVLVMDEAGKYVISLVSGHIGGANRLALRVSESLGAEPVITTATDVNGKFAVDVFARDNGLVIDSMKAAKEISAAVLRENRVYLYCEGKIKGKFPEELTLWEQRELPQEKEGAVIWISPFLPEKPKEDFQGTVLHLIPKAVSVGIGCRRGKSREEIQQTVLEAASLAGVMSGAFEQAASVDLKKGEPGILGFCQEWGLPYRTYSSEELSEVTGEFSSSAFVKEITGTDNVCERAALACAGSGGRLIQRKYAKNGVTAALAVREWSVDFGK
ncbi:MAG TPA: cobalt-precorrin 5A hydrolase [Candidatus Choladousia intestinigallinarum]|nr:cobalt-precorrin 5A hydrolase [Candidatus Choladousia intestinigallinarum]